MEKLNLEEIKILSQGMEEQEAKKNKDKFTETAKTRIKTGLILNEFGEQNKIEVSEQEIQAEVQKQLRMMPGQEKMVMDFYQKNPSAIASLRGTVYEDKIINSIKEKAKSNKKEITKDEAEKILKQSQKQQLDQELQDQRKPEKKVEVKKESKKVITPILAIEDIKKQNPDMSDEDIYKEIEERSDGVYTAEELKQIRESKNLQEAGRLNENYKRAMANAHEEVVSGAKDADDEYYKENGPAKVNDITGEPENGPHVRGYVKSWMKGMHWDAYIDNLA